MKRLVLIIPFVVLALALPAQNWTDSTGRIVGQQSQGSRYYTVDKNDVNQRLAAWLRTHTLQERGKMSCTSDLDVELTIQNAADQKPFSELHVGDEVEFVIENKTKKRLYAAVAFVDRYEQWHIVSSAAGSIAFDFPAGKKAILPVTTTVKEPLGTGHYVLIAFTERFDPQSVIDTYTTQFLYERHVKAGASIVEVTVRK